LCARALAKTELFDCRKPIIFQGNRSLINTSLLRIQLKLEGQQRRLQVTHAGLGLATVRVCNFIVIVPPK